MNKISAVIPTLQKNKELLYNLIDNLENDSNVDEIILIDNSLSGCNHPCKKIKLIIPKENMFVNPSWNLGVKEAKNDLIAILNDDITIPDNFCSNVVKKMNENMGIVGCNADYVNETKEIKKPKQKEIILLPIDYRCSAFGVALFFNKKSYFEIPEDLKIYFGDDWLFFKNKKLKRTNYSITGQTINHFGCLSSNSYNKYFNDEYKIYKKKTYKFYQYFINFEKIHNGFRIYFFGIKYRKTFKN